MVNYIPDLNPFHLSGPPKWWLERLWDFDSSLCVLPSRQGFYYRLAQKRPPSLPTKVVEDILKEQGDTRMLSSYNLIPVTTILATANWSNPLMWEDLRQRAPWRMGGAQKVINEIETREKMEDLNRRAQTDELLTYLGKDAWGLYKKKIGTRSHMYSPKTKGGGNSSPAPAIKTQTKTSYKPIVITDFVR